MDSRPDLVALDLDGTLLDSERQLGERTATAVRALAALGTHVVLATGRPPRLTSRYVHELGLEYALTYNGASTYRASTRTLEHHHQLERDLALDILRHLRAHVPDILIGLETHHGWYLDPLLDERRRQNPMFRPPDGVGEVEGFVKDAVIKVFARHPERDARSMAAAVEDLDVYATWTHPALLEVMHPAVNKRAALARLAKALGVPRARTAAFGDGHNDVQVLAWAGHGVAMAGGCIEARAAADEIAPGHDVEGVAVVLERWL